MIRPRAATVILFVALTTALGGAAHGAEPQDRASFPVVGVALDASPFDLTAPAGSRDVDRYRVTETQARAFVALEFAEPVDGPFGPAEALIRLAVEQDLDPIGWPDRRHNLTIEEIDATEFRLEHALSLRLRGRVNDLVRYETRIRLRSSGLRELSARLRIEF